MVCYVTNKIFYNTKNCILNEIENIFIELLIPKTIPITVGIIYKTSRSNKVSINTVRQFKLDQYVKRRMAYTRGSEYRNGSILEEENKNIINNSKYLLNKKISRILVKLLVLDK